MRALRLARICSVMVFAACASERATGDHHDAGRADAAGDAPSPLVVNTVDDCFVGAMFAECPGPDDPKIFCTEQADCLWISNGRPLGSYDQPIGDCVLAGGDGGSSYAQWFMMTWGDGPWTRTREMHLDVLFDSALEEGGLPAVTTCTGDPQRFCSHYAAKPRYLGSTYGIRGTEAVQLVLSDLSPSVLMVEIDPAASPPRARVCVWQGSDAMECSPLPTKECAEAGSVTLAHAPVKGSAPPACKFVAEFASGRIEGTCGAPTAPQAPGPITAAVCATIEHDSSVPTRCTIVAESCEVDGEGGWAFRAQVDHPGKDDDRSAPIPGTTCTVFPHGSKDPADATVTSFSATEQDLQRACSSVEHALVLFNAKCGWAIDPVP